MDFALSAEHLSVQFPSRQGNLLAVDDLNLQVSPGQVFGFLGPNGAGKTTTMHVFLGFIAATSGTARIFGEDVALSIARRRIGYLPENPDTYRFMTGRELLAMTAHLFRMTGPAMRNRIREVLEQVRMENAADRCIATYSRGMVQRICLAQALINDPDLLILDEPTGGLDPFGRMQVREIIAGLRARGKTVFFSSHELSEVELVCDHIAILSNGRVVAQGAAAELVPPSGSLEKFFIQVAGRHVVGGSETGNTHS